jgi:hypothetical protein
MSLSSYHDDYFRNALTMSDDQELFNRTEHLRLGIFKS